MNRKTVTGAAVLAGAAILLPTGSAQAAAPHVSPAKCVLGSWRLLGENFQIRGVNKEGKFYQQRATGGTGLRLTVHPTWEAVSFAGSKREYFSGITAFHQPPFSTQYAGWIALHSSASAKGVFTASPKGARGNATYINYEAGYRPYHGSLMKDLQQPGDFEPLLPYNATFTCTASTLTLHVHNTHHFKNGYSSVTNTLVYRRI
jgi:hypothetical protein